VLDGRQHTSPPCWPARAFQALLHQNTLLRLPDITERSGVFEISARFSFCDLVGVGCRMISSDHTWHTGGYTREKPMCAYRSAR
jgi:hypothetical protein